MSNTFSFVGYLRPVKDSEKMKGFTTATYDSGWMSERLRFNVIAGDNRHLVEINAGRWQDENKNVIYGITKSENGKKSETFQIPWDKRNSAEMIEKMAGWRVFTVDTETYSHREELKESGDEEGLKAANKKRKHFLAATEFCEYVNKVVNSEKTRDMKFRVNGNVNYTYSAKDDKYYSTYEVNKIYRVDDDKDPASDISIDFYYTEGAMDCEDYEDTGRAIVSGYTKFYDNNTKKNWYCPMNLMMRFGTDETGQKKIKGWKKFFDKFEDEPVRRVVFACQQINGAQRVNITYDDLSDETKEYIDCGMVSLEQALRDAGGQKMGEKMQEIRIIEFARGFSRGSEEAHLTVEDLRKKPFKETENNDADIFDDDEDEDL